MSSQQSRSRIWTRFWAVNALDRGEVHLSVRGLLDVPHLARPSRPCKLRPRPCSCRLPAAGTVFVYLFFFPKRLFVRIDTYKSGKLSCKNLNRWTGRLLSLLPRRPWFESRIMVCVFSCDISRFSTLCKNVYDDWSFLWAIDKSVLYAYIEYSAAAAAAAALQCIVVAVVSLFVT